MILPQVLWGVLLPAVVAGVVLLFLGGRIPAAAAALAVGAGYAAGCFALWGMPPFPPIDSGDWIFWLAIAAAGVAPLPLPPRARRLAGAAIACGLSLLVLLPVVRRNWSAPLGVAAVAGWSAAVLAFWWPLERLSKGEPITEIWVGAGCRRHWLISSTVFQASGVPANRSTLVGAPGPPGGLGGLRKRRRAGFTAHR